MHNENRDVNPGFFPVPGPGFDKPGYATPPICDTEVPVLTASLLVTLLLNSFIFYQSILIYNYILVK